MRVVVWGPDDRLITRGHQSAEGPRATATSHVLDTGEGGAEVELSLNGEVARVEAFEEVEVSEEVATLLEQSGYEIEYLGEEGEHSA